MTRPRTWQLLPADQTVTYSPIGLRVRDDFTGRGPVGQVSAALDRRDGTDWIATDIAGVWGPGFTLRYPGLGRQRQVVGLAPGRYRVRIAAEHYVPVYRSTVDGIEFDVHPYNDSNPPAVVAPNAVDVALTPAPTYPFPGHVAVLRGVVVDATAGNAPVADAEVTEGTRELTVTDGRGRFALPLRWVSAGAMTPIDAVYRRSTPNLTGTLVVTLPAALGGSQTVAIS